jgi:hypothetical protein
MIGFPAKAVNPTTTVRVSVTSKENKSLIRGYLQRELRKIDGVEVRDVAEWAILVTAIQHRDGLHVIGTTVVRNKYMRLYLKDTLAEEVKDRLSVIPVYYDSTLHTNYELDELCASFVVMIEDYLLR